jgi:hypothetical protein
MLRRDDLEGLQTILDGLTGQPFLMARRAYGDELRLHFGRPVPYHGAALAGQAHGEWVLGTRASPWHLAGPGGPVTSAEYPPNSPAAELDVLAGTKVTQACVFPPDFDLQIAFNNRFALIVTVNGDDDGLAGWEFFTPGQLVITIGPGRYWRLSRADSPADE